MPNHMQNHRSEGDKVLLHIENDVATIMLNRSHVSNAFDETSIYLLDTYLKQLMHHDEVKFLILRGEGDNFCAGADANWMKKMQNYSLTENKDDSLQFANLMQALFNFPKPIICFVQGAVYGGGIGLLACSDIVIANHNTQFCFSEVKLGLIPAVISPYVVTAIGLRQAKRYMLSAEIFGAETAEELGLIHEIVDISITDQKALNEMLKPWISMLQKNGPEALIKCKALLQYYTDPTHLNLNSDLLQYTANLIAEIRVSEEGQEGLLAFLEKRKPNWQSNIR